MAYRRREEEDRPRRRDRDDDYGPKPPKPMFMLVAEKAFPPSNHATCRIVVPAHIRPYAEPRGKAVGQFVTARQCGLVMGATTASDLMLLQAAHEKRSHA